MVAQSHTRVEAEKHKHLCICTSLFFLLKKGK